MALIQGFLPRTPTENFYVNINGKSIGGFSRNVLLENDILAFLKDFFPKLKNPQKKTSSGEADLV